MSDQAVTHDTPHAPPQSGRQRTPQHELVKKSLGRRHAAEKRFRAAGMSAVLFGLAMVALLFVTIFAKGIQAFWQATFNIPVYFDPEIVKVEPRPQAQPGETPVDRKSVV